MKKQRGILYSPSMVLAKLAGTKTQTRRIVKPQPSDKAIPDFIELDDDFVGPSRPDLLGKWQYYTDNGEVNISCLTITRMEMCTKRTNKIL